MEKVILVDEADNEIGYEEKYECHKIPVKLHRAFSIFIFNKKGEMLITKRAGSKYHWGGYWTNACCSHPRPNEPVELAAKRRLEEELGFSCELKYLFKFIYKADFDKTWGEHELDHVFLGIYDGDIKPNKEELDDFKFVSLEELEKSINEMPNIYTPWFKIALNRVIDNAKKQKIL